MPGTNPDPRGYYALLHVSPDASRQEIGRAFRALMRRGHPDVGHPGTGHPDDEVDVHAILDAFAVLRDPRARAGYDASGGYTGGGVTGGAGPGSPGTEKAGTGGTAAGSATAGGRDIPVRIVRRREPPLRVLPVRWETGPWPDQHPRGGR